MNKRRVMWPLDNHGGFWAKLGGRLQGLRARWRPRPARQLRLCETLGLGERRFLAVVQFEQQRFLIAGTGTAVAMLAQLPAVESAELRNAAATRMKETW